MRVIHVAPASFGPEGILGGGERYPLELARALAPLVETELITFGAQSSVRKDDAGLTTRTLAARDAFRGRALKPWAAELARAERPGDVVHSHHLRALSTKVAGVAARLHGRAHVVTDHGFQGGDWNRRLHRLVDEFLLVSRYSATELGAPVDRTRVIHGGADPRRFRQYPAVARGGVLFVGRLTPHKGVDRLLEALPAGAHLRIAGSTGHDPGAPERDYPALLQRLAAGHEVTFLGPVPDAFLPELYRSSSVLVLPSVHMTCYGRFVKVSELLSLTAIEAMASGTPVICSRVGGIPEVVEDGVTGFLVEPGNVEELGGRISEVLADPALTARLGRNGRELVLDRFTWDAVARRCLDSYAALAGRRQRRLEKRSTAMQ